MSKWKGTIAKGFTAEEFDAYAAGITLGDWIPEFIVCHNTQNPTLAQWHNVTGERRMSSLADYYRDDQKWSGGPHLFVADDLIWVFTPLTVPGVHSPSWNDTSWGVETVGDFDHELLEGTQLDNLISALAALHRLAGWDRAEIKLHKDDPKTTHTFCPGKHFNRDDVTQMLIDAL